jgi:iron complex outermembrane receptor protein
LEIFYAPIRNYQAVLGYTNLWTTETIANKENANLVGRGLQFTPKQTVSFWNRYTFTGGRLNHLTVGGGLRYNGKHEALANLDWFKVINPDWVRVDLMLGYETKLFGRKTYLQLNVENLTNKYYYDGEYTAGRPLTAILRARFTF